MSFDRKLGARIQDLRSVVISGDLLKQGHKRKNWRRRRFLLSGTRLYYFKSAFDLGPCLGMLELADASIEIVPAQRSGPKNVFNIITASSDSNNLLISCESAEERREWMEALASVSSELSLPPPPSLADVKLDCTKQGQLMKKGAKRRNWKQRFFVLKDGLLFYFRNEDSKEQPIATISVRGSYISRERTYGVRNFPFSMRRYPRSFFFDAPSFEEMMSWIAALASHGAIEVAPGSPLGAFFGDDSFLGKQASNRSTVEGHRSTEKGRLSPVGNLLALHGGRLSSFSRIPTAKEKGGHLVTRYPSYDATFASLRRARAHLERTQRVNPRILSIVSDNICHLPIDAFSTIVKEHLSLLCLSFNQLVFFPSELCDCVNLTRLLIHNNNISSLPSEIEKLTNLTELYVNGNELTELPAALGNCKKLCELSVSSNRLRRLPKEIGQLSQLVMLFCSSNQLLLLPDEICQCKELEFLYVNNNDIRFLPTELRSLTKLKEFFFTCNPVFDVLRPFLVSKAIEHVMTKERIRFLDDDKQKVQQSAPVPIRTWNVPCGSDGFPLSTVHENIQKVTNDEIISVLNGKPFESSMRILKNEHFERHPEAEPMYGSVRFRPHARISQARQGRSQSAVLTRFSSGIAPSNTVAGLEKETMESFHSRLMAAIQDAQDHHKEQLVFAHQNHVKVSDDSHLALAIPRELCSCTALTLVDLTGNHIFSLPKEIFLLTKCMDLILSQNDLQSLPKELGQCPSLYTLDLSENRFLRLPFVTLTNIESLHVLDASHNRLQTLFEEENEVYDDPTHDMEVRPVSLSLETTGTDAGELLAGLDTDNLSDAMKRSSLFGNALGFSPFSFSERWSVPSNILEELWTRTTRRTSSGSSSSSILEDAKDFGDSPGEDGSIEAIIRKKQRELYLSMRKLKQLQMVNISHNDLSRLPHSIGALPAVVEWDASYNSLTSLPRSIGTLGRMLRTGETSEDSKKISPYKYSLLKMFLLHNRISSLPSEIGHCKCLVVLDLSYNRLTSLPRSIGNLAELRSLSVSHNELEEIPFEIGCCRSMISLDLSYNKLTSLPSWIGRLDSMVSLDVRRNSLMSIPSEFGKLDSLVTLMLSSNRLRKLPVEISHLRALKTLEIADNRFLEVPDPVIPVVHRGVFVDVVEIGEDAVEEVEEPSDESDGE